MHVRKRALCVPSILILAAELLVLSSVSSAQEPAPAGTLAAAGGEDLEQLEARLAERYDRLELLVARLAELSGSAQPQRATLLRQLVAQSRDRDVAGQFDKVVEALENRSYSSAIDGQTALETELQKLLELLLQEDRDRQIESERKRIGRYLQDVNKLIRLQRGVQGRTDGGDDAKELAEDQHRVSDQTGKLEQEIAESEETAEQQARRERGDQSKPGDSQSGEGEPKDGKSEDENKAGDKSSSEESNEKPQEGDSDSKPSESGEQEASEGQPSQPKGQQGKPGEPSEGSPSEGQPSEQQGDQSQQEQSSPMQRTAQRLKQAQQRMEDAKKQLDEAKREGAVKDQAKAVEELEQAKAELERILRQLREEELERMLVMLEARIRKMLEDQIEIYDETKQLDEAAGKAAEHELEIASGRLSRKESLIVREANRALVLLREDGTSVAFPEAIEQARDDMQSISNRLRDAKVDLLTQGLEEDVIAALEQSLAALQQALKDLRDQKGQPARPGEGAPGEKALVDNLAELRMIRALQARVNNRTRQYGALIDGEQAMVADLIQALGGLSIRQQKIFQATQDLSKEER